jgi:hypothetical protein
MGPTDKAFSQVKNILGKLDRNIDQVRSKRLHPEPLPGAETLIGTRETLGPDTLIGVPKAQPATNGGYTNGSYQPAAATPAPFQAPGTTPVTPPRSAFGRAKPLIAEPPPSSALWKTN